MKNMSKLLILAAFCVCMAGLLCGCGSEAAPAETTAPVQTQEVTEAPTTEPTEPEPVYELQTVYLCVEEYLQNYEGGNFRKGYTYDEYGRVTEYFLIQNDGSRGWVTEYSYDENGNLIEERTGDSVSVMTYDEAGHLLSKIYYYQEERTTKPITSTMRRAM